MQHSQVALLHVHAQYCGIHSTESNGHGWRVHAILEVKNLFEIVMAIMSGKEFQYCSIADTFYAFKLSNHLRLHDPGHTNDSGLKIKISH